jgi:hypothetical protein
MPQDPMNHLMVLVNKASDEDKAFVEILKDLSVFRSNYQHKDHLTDSEVIAKECQWTDLLIKILKYGNEYQLLSFQYRVVMEEDE